MRVFLDTNVLASAFGVGGLCRELMELVIGQHELICGEPVLAELERVLRDKFRLPAAHIDRALVVLRHGEVQAASQVNLSGIPDLDDIPILACALAAHAEAFVTGDAALLELGRVEGMPIVTPRTCYERLSGLG